MEAWQRRALFEDGLMGKRAWIVTALLAGVGAAPSGPEPDPTRPALVTLNFRNQPVPDVVSALVERSGNPIKLQFHTQAGQAQGITLEAPESLPFWEALDRLCQAVGLQRHLIEGWPLGSIRDRLSLDGPLGSIEYGPAHYVGPFRLGQFSLQRYHRHIYVPERQQPYRVDFGPAYAEFEVLSEPRVLAVRTGPVTVIEAVDDQGRSLLDSEALAEVDGSNAGRGLDAPARIHISLDLPKEPGGRLVRLRGVMPVEVGVRPTEPTRVIPLEGSGGRTFRAGDLGVTIREFTLTDDGLAHLVLTVRIESQRGIRERVPRNVLNARLMNILNRQLELVDAQGRPVGGLSGGAGPKDGTLRADYRTSPPYGSQGATAPTHLRVHAPVWVAWDVPFEFTDMPLP